MALDKRKLTSDEIMQIVELFESSSELSEFHLRFGDTILDLLKLGTSGSATREVASPAVQKGAGEVPPMAQPPETREPWEPVTPTATPPAAETMPANAFLIKSPTVGTFFCAPESGGTPFVSVGQRVVPTTTVCIVEIMKLMNAIQAGCSGVVSQILVKNEEKVEFGQTLIVIDQD